MSIAAPATNPASDLELKLPATIGSANQVLRNSSTAGTLEFAPAGLVLQVKMAVLASDINAGPTSYTDLGLSETITLASTSNKILVSLSTTPYVGGTSEEKFGLRIQVTPSGGSATTIVEDGHYAYRTNDDWKSSNGHYQCLYSPSSTAQLTINCQYKRITGGDNLWLESNGDAPSVNTLMIQEISG